MHISYGKFQHSVLSRSLGGIWVLGFLLWTLPVSGADPIVPWECTGFSGEAQSRCVRTFTELQQEKIAKLEKELEIQKGTVQHLQHQVAQQASATADLKRQFRRKQSRWYRSPFVNIYPPLGFSLGFGRDRHFGGSLFLGRPYFYGPRFYGYGHRRWHRH